MDEGIKVARGRHPEVRALASSKDDTRNFRGFKGAPSYPSRTKDIDDVDFSTGSVGLGVARTLFSPRVQNYVNRLFRGCRRGGRNLTESGRVCPVASYLGVGLSPMRASSIAGQCARE